MPRSRFAKANKGSMGRLVSHKPTKNVAVEKRSDTRPNAARHAAPCTVTDPGQAVDQLLQLYAQIDKNAVELPFAMKPAFSPLRRNPFRVWADQWRALWMGELTFVLVPFRPLVRSMLHRHFRRRLTALHEQILLNSGFSEDNEQICTRIERALDFWRPRITVRSVLFTWVLPLAGPVTGLWAWLFPNTFVTQTPSEIVHWVLTTFVMSFGYAIFFLIAAFSVKRGLMLGGIGRSTLYPASLLGSGGYGKEKGILGAFGIVRSEFPLDAASLLGWLLLWLLFVAAAFWRDPSALHFLVSENPWMVFGMVFTLILFGILSLIVLSQRKRLGRE